MPEKNGEPSLHLRTRYVFVDAQALRKARFDWDGRLLSKLVEFAKEGHLRLLVTAITVREVESQLKELLLEANAALTKHSSILRQLDASVAVNGVKDETKALGTLVAAFEKFRARTKAIDVPLIGNIKVVLDDYFDRRPPFSAKKKHEFPDAISIASVRAWCEQKRHTAYVVSEDPDLRSCCSESGPLFHVETIAEIISHATVSQGLHNKLAEALGSSRHLEDTLAEQVKQADIEIALSLRDMIQRSKIEAVHNVQMISTNVLEQHGRTFTCELEVEAEVELTIEIETEGGYRYGSDSDEYEPPRRQTLSRTITAYFYPEVIVQFDQSTGELDFESIWTGGTVQIDRDVLWRW